MWTYMLQTYQPIWVGYVVSVSASHTVGRGSCPSQVIRRPSEKWYRLPPCLACMRKGRSLTVQPDYGDMHCSWDQSPGINHKSRVSWFGFLSSATWPSMPKKHYNGLINQSINQQT